MGGGYADTEAYLSKQVKVLVLKERLEWALEH